MGSMDKPQVVAVINSTKDIVDLMRIWIEQAGFVVVTAMTTEIRDGEVDVELFIRHHDPRVIVYDVAPPYEPNWRLFEHIAALPVMAGRQFVLTSTNVAQIQRLGFSHQSVYEIVGKPDDLDRIVQAVKEASRARPIR
jgi:DNA-binding NtrC family response regulator